MRDYLPLLIILIVVAGLVKADKALAILYLIAILILVTRWWNRNVIRGVILERELTGRAFLEQEVPVSLKVSNTSLLPVVWLQLHESLPIEMIVPGYFSQVVTLGSHQSMNLKYSLYPQKRGCYQIGPTFLSSGDLLGIGKDTHKEIPANSLIVYPRIVNLESLGLPSQSMFGSIREKNPIYEDPSRTFGKRNFTSTDSLRKVDWKASAALGNLQVKLFEASKTLELAIYLDLNFKSYETMHHYDQTELAIVTAASVANWGVKRKHAIGLITNGEDPFKADTPLTPLIPRKGNAQLMLLLEILARIRSCDAEDAPALINRTSSVLPWGTTLLIITGRLSVVLLDELIRARKRGFNLALINIGNYPGLLENQQRARKSGFTVYHIQTLIDLDQREVV